MNIVEPIKEKSKIEEMKKILSNNERNLLLFKMGINSGLRVSDILALNVKDVKNKNYIELREKKTNKYKKFSLNPKLQLDLSNYVKNRNNEEPLFLTQKRD